MNAVHAEPRAVGRDDAVLVADGLAKHYSVRRGLFKGQATVKALNGVSFTLARGRTLAVVGESGCGKSTLARQLTMIETPTAGQLRIDGEDVAGASGETIAALRRRVQMVFQNPYASLNPRKTVEQTLAEPLADQHEPDGGRARRAHRADDAHGRPAARARQALSAHVLGRPAPAHRDRAGDDARSADRGGRRAGLGARRVDPGADPEPVHGPAAAVRHQLRVHLAQPGGGRARRRRRDGDVPRRGGGARRQGHSVRAAAPSLHARAALGDPGDLRIGPGASEDQAAGRTALAAQPAVGLRLPPALPVRDRAVPRRGARAAGGRWAAGGLPSRRGGR